MAHTRLGILALIGVVPQMRPGALGWKPVVGRSLQRRALGLEVPPLNPEGVDGLFACCDGGAAGLGDLGRGAVAHHHVGLDALPAGRNALLVHQRIDLGHSAAHVMGTDVYGTRCRSGIRIDLLHPSPAEGIFPANTVDAVAVVLRPCGR